MWPFKKKVKEEKPKVLYTDYTNWDKDLGFLTLVMTRKKNITKNYYISIYSTQLKDTDYVRDEDLQDIIINSVSEVIKELSVSYKEFLIGKYFGSEKELVKFMTEDFYVDFTNSAISQNFEKIKQNATKKRVSNLNRLNMSQEVKEDEEEKKEE
jgi:hypothetical protein